MAVNANRNVFRNCLTVPRSRATLKCFPVSTVANTAADLHGLTGVIPPMITPFAEDDSIDHARLREEALFLKACGVDGLVVAGSTGEGAGMSEDELASTCRTVIEAVEGSIP